MTAYQYRMPSGVPGTGSRMEHATVVAELVDSTNPPTAYGLPVVINPTSRKIQPVGTGNVAGDVYGFNVRPYPAGGTPLANDPLGTTTPPTAGITNIMTRGWMMVMLGGTTAAAKGSPAYVRVATPSAGKPIGGLEAAADGANTILLDGSTGNAMRVTFVGPADAQGNIEIAINI